MTRKGYTAELQAKNKLINLYGFHNVFKNAISNQGADYLVFAKQHLVKCVEVKQCHSKKYYPSKKEISQFLRIKAFCDEHSIKCELWIKYPSRGWEYKLIDDYLYKDNNTS